MAGVTKWLELVLFHQIRNLGLTRWGHLLLESWQKEAWVKILP